MVTINDLAFLGFNYENEMNKPWESSLFKFMVFPDDDEHPFKHKRFLMELLRHCGKFCASPQDFIEFQMSIGGWTKLRLAYWQRMYDALLLEYEPLHNYDRTEEEEIVEDNTREVGSNDAGQVAGYDSGTLVDNAATHSEGEEQENNQRIRKMRAYGNIGVTSSQELIQQELEVAQQSIYNIILGEFKDQFCVLVY